MYNLENTKKIKINIPKYSGEVEKKNKFNDEAKKV